MQSPPYSKTSGKRVSKTRFLLCGNKIPSNRVAEMMPTVMYVNLSCGMNPVPPGRLSELLDC